MSDGKDKVIFLAFDNPDLRRESKIVIACKNCNNKTWILVEPDPGKAFPVLQCSVCGFIGGRIGWVHDA
jgi:hypothetical protein